MDAVNEVKQDTSEIPRHNVICIFSQMTSDNF